MFKHFTYYLLLTLLCCFAIDLVLDSWFRYFLYGVMFYAIPLPKEFEDYDAIVFNIVYNGEVKNYDVLLRRAEHSKERTTVEFENGSCLTFLKNRANDIKVTR